MEPVILFAVIVGLAAFVAAPLYRTQGVAPPDRRAELEARRDTLLRSLREIEIDHTSGLIADEEYERQRAAMEGETADLLRRLATD